MVAFCHTCNTNEAKEINYQENPLFKDLPALAISASNMGIKQFELLEAQILRNRNNSSVMNLPIVDITKTCGHMSKKQTQVLQAYVKTLKHFFKNRSGIRLTNQASEVILVEGTFIDEVIEMQTKTLAAIEDKESSNYKETKDSLFFMFKLILQSGKER
jgi:hypothetical protein